MEKPCRTKAIWQTLVIQHGFPSSTAVVALLKAKPIIQVKIRHGRDISHIAQTVCEIWRKE